MPGLEPVSRRAFMADLGRISIGVVLFGAAVACTSDEDPAATSSPTGSPARSPTGAALGGWERVNLGFVSAYVLVRSDVAVVVDTGVEGSTDEIEQVLAEAGAKWNQVGHVILTHKHPDHIGSFSALMEKATQATPYAGPEDISSIDTPVKIEPVTDTDTVAGLEIIATPGHTAGHISVLDPTARVFVAGDALTGSEGSVAGPNAEFTEDMDVALESIAKIAKLDFDIAVFGHGDPLTTGASAKVGELA